MSRNIEPAGEVAPDRVLQVDVAEALSHPQYRFCSDPSYRLWEADKRELCDDLDQLRGVCPQLEAACSRPPWEDELKAPESDWDLGFLGDVFEALGAVLEPLLLVLFWGGLALGLFLLARVIARHAKSAGSKDEDEAPATARAETTRIEEKEEHRADVLLDLCQKALARGQLHEALHLAYRATVRQLGEAQLVEVHRSRTSGDYLRQLARSSSSSAETAKMAAEHLRQLDGARFRGELHGERARSLTERTRELVQRLAPALTILLALISTSCDLPSIPEAPNAPRAPKGHQLLQDLLETRAESVTRRLRRVTSLPEDTTTVVALSPGLKPLEWATLRRWVESGGHLVLAGQASGFEEEFEVSLSHTDCFAELRLPHLELSTLSHHSGIDVASDRTPLVACGDRTYAVDLFFGAGSVTLVGDATLFQNAHLAAADNASLAFYLVDLTGGHVELLGPWTGRGAMHPLDSVTKAGLGVWILQLLLLVAVYAWSRGRRFGSPIDPPARRRRSFSEHADALARHYSRKGALGTALQHYGEWAVEQLRRRTPSHKDEARPLARALSRNAEETSTLQRALVTARRAEQLGSRDEELLSAYRALRAAVRNRSGRSS